MCKLITNPTHGVDTNCVRAHPSFFFCWCGMGRSCELHYTQTAHSSWVRFSSRYTTGDKLTTFITAVITRCARSLPDDTSIVGLLAGGCPHFNCARCATNFSSRLRKHTMSRFHRTIANALGETTPDSECRIWTRLRTHGITMETCPHV